MKESKEEATTKVFPEEFLGKQMFTIWTVDEDGEKTGKKNVVNFGITKAKAILNHLEGLKEFVKKNG